jgi:hypothetical protein
MKCIRYNMKKSVIVFALMIVLLSCFAAAEVSSTITQDFYLTENIAADAGEAQEDVSAICSQNITYWIIGILVLIILSIILRKNIDKIFGQKKVKRGKKKRHK